MPPITLCVSSILLLLEVELVLTTLSSSLVPNLEVRVPPEGNKVNLR